MPTIKFSQHAIDRIKFRKISKTKIAKTISSPYNENVSYRGRKIFIKKFQSKTLEVVTKKEGDDIIVITAYYLFEK